MNKFSIKKKLVLIFMIAATVCLTLCAFTFDKNSSVKSLTKPYITTYDCTLARLGDEDLLERYEYLKITFIDDKKLEVSFKRKKGKHRAYECEYKHDEENGTFSAEMGILGFKFRQETKIENGKFTLYMPIFGKPLVMQFSS